MSPLALATLLLVLSLSKSSPIQLSQEHNVIELSYSVDPNFVFFPGEISLSKLTSIFNQSDVIRQSGKHAARISNFLSTPCSLDINSHATNEINKSLLMRLLNTTLGNTDLMCDWPSHKIMGVGFPEHTMLTTYLKMQLTQLSEAKE